MDPDEETLERGDRDRDQLARPPGSAAARLHRQQQQGHE